MSKVFLIEYTVYSTSNTVLKSGTMRCKNKASKFEASCSLEVFLKKSVKDFNKMVIKSCEEEKPKSNIEDMFESFGKIFNSDKDWFGDFLKKGKK